MTGIDFTKMVAAGNDFVVVDNILGNYKLDSAAWRDLAIAVCADKYGLGTDGMLLLEGVSGADISMRIFNSDGSEADMCGNGARCCAKYFDFYVSSVKAGLIKIQTKAGNLEASVSGDMVKLKMSLPRDIKLNIPLTVGKAQYIAHHINTGVPHAVIFVKDLDKIDVNGLGSKIRNHQQFAPKGTNVDFVKVLDKEDIAVRTYERGVEGETLACGTGSVASALMYVLEACLRQPNFNANGCVRVHTKSKEILNVFFNKQGQNFVNIFLEGSARIVCRGRFNYGS